MKKSPHNPLSFYCNQLIELFQKSIASENPALFLYKKKTRSVLFNAEAIARLLNNIERKRITAKGLTSFKKPEDILGEIEDYDTYLKVFSKNKLIKKPQFDYFVKKYNRSLEKLNRKLAKKDFYQDIFNKLLCFKIDFNNHALITSLEKQIKLEIKIAFDFYSGYPEKFTDLGSQVHELRRKLRWISMYAQSLKGVVVLKPDKIKYSWEYKFIPKNPAASPYNKVQTKKGLVKYIAFNKKAFYALNEVIDKLGDIKDRGMAIENLTKSIKKAGGQTVKQPTEVALRQLGDKYTEPDLLKAAHTLLHNFFVTNKIHEKLVY